MFDDFDTKVNVEEIVPDYYYLMDDEDWDVWLDDELDEDFNI